MKTIIYISLILTVIGACRSNKKAYHHQSRSQLMQNLKSTEHQKTYANQQYYLLDSAVYGWEFVSNRPFFYHPDTGLQASEGVMRVLGQYVRQEQLSAESDSTALKYKNTAYYVEQEEIARQNKRWGADRAGWLLAGLLLLAGLYFIGVRRWKG